ncbi:hypothetical protein ABT369_50330 [Dactylosporangium sp. NPDC000244]|uniref:hypothetical protein n=1 Tax=Dactylosporangium sp. NPDC000244 TaxID=3154365 RepID=UPI00332D94EE
MEVTATDVAEAVVFAVTRHPRFAVHEVLVRPAGRSSERGSLFGERAAPRVRELLEDGDDTWS